MTGTAEKNFSTSKKVLETQTLSIRVGSERGDGPRGQ